MMTSPNLYKTNPTEAELLPAGMNVTYADKGKASDAPNIFLFSGIRNEVTPTRLLLDDRLTPMARNGWLVLRLLMGRGLRASPSYEDLKPYLSTFPCSGKISRVLIARIIAHLRLTGWITLVRRQRDDKTGQFQGSIYMLHDDPRDAPERVIMDGAYLEFVSQMLRHTDPSTRFLARLAKDEIDHADPELKTGLAAIEERINRGMDADPLAMERHSPKRRAKPAAPTPQSSHLEAELSKLKSELGQLKAELGHTSPRSDLRHSPKKPEHGSKTPCSDSELGEKTPDSESERGGKLHEYAKTQHNQNMNSANTGDLSTSTCTGNYINTGTGTCEGRSGVDVDPEHSEHLWPQVIRLSNKEWQKVETTLLSLPPSQRYQVLEEARLRISLGGVRHHLSYLMGLIRRAKNGELRPSAVGNLKTHEPSHESFCQDRPSHNRLEVAPMAQPPLFEGSAHDQPCTKEQLDKVKMLFDDMKRKLGKS